MVGAAGAATGTVVAIIAGATSTIRVGAGGIMLPNHAPLTVAEQFGTIESLYPGRVDLGLGRAPGTDPTRRLPCGANSMRAQQFPQEVMELREYFSAARPSKSYAPCRGPAWTCRSGSSGRANRADVSRRH